MECTQRLECTQDLYGTQSEIPIPEQIGYLGICGTKYPVKKGPNKIGRDPQTCSIILNLNSVSRQHAVINILNKNNFMLMDLDSANKTKLSGKTLQAYMPHPLHNGDTVQFGEIFGIFRLIEEEDDLPMTQAIDIPDTPVPTKHMSRINAVTTIPESPDVSDRDDSFIVPSQPKNQQFQSSKTLNFIKPGKTISIQPIGTNKIDNIYWNSSKKSTSLNLDDSNRSMNDSIQAAKSNDNAQEVDIHELETQEMFPAQKNNDESTDSIYTANTQLPELDNAAPSIYTADTQMPVGTSPLSIHNLNTQMPCETSSPSIHTLTTQMPGAFEPSIYSLETQMPPGDHLPDVYKINDQQDMHFDLCVNKNNNDTIYNAETQMVPTEETSVPFNSSKKNELSSSKESGQKTNASNDQILFDEDDSQPNEEGLEYQTIMPEDIELPINRLIGPETETESQSQIVMSKCVKRNMRINSDSSTDCEDIDMLPTQKLSEINNGEGDITDCEEEIIDLKMANNKTDAAGSPKPADNFEDLATQVIVHDEPPVNTNESNEEFEDMLTQVINIDEIEKKAVEENCNNDPSFEDLPTQVLDDENVRIKETHDSPRFANEEEISPFKVPLNSALKAKKKDLSRMLKIKSVSAINQSSFNEDDSMYYRDTQDIYEDLCSQKVDKPTDRVNVKTLSRGNENPENKSVSNKKEVDVEEGVNDFVMNLSSQEVRDVIGVDTEVAKLTKISSDGSSASDIEITPKKNKPFKFMDNDLPNSQEIKTNMTICPRTISAETSSESDTENNSEDQCTPILFPKIKKVKSQAKLDLTKKFDIEALPSRIITRIRKPTAKLQDQEKKKVSENILKPKFLVEHEGDINTEIITENITRLKSKNEKSKNAKNNNNLSKETKQTDVMMESIAESVKNERSCRKKLEKQDGDKLERKSDKTQHSSKDGKRKKIESKNNQNEPLEHKSQMLMTSKSINQWLDSALESKDETQTSNILKKISSEAKNEASIANESTKPLHDLKKTRDKTCSSNKNKKETPNSKNDPIKITQQSLNSTIPTNDKTRLSNKSITIANVDLTDSPDDIKSTRRARNAKTKGATTKTERKSTPESPDAVSHTEKTKRKYSRKKEPKVENKKKAEEDMPAEKEVRRSKRQRTVKEKKEEEPVKVPKSILKRNVTVSHEESAVYNLSSGSNSDTSRSLKRPALDESDVSNPKRARSVVVNNVSLRATPARSIKHYVLSTAFPCETLKGKLEKLGAVVVTDVMKSTVVLTLQIKRTFKLLCAVGLGKPIVGQDWVQACVDSNMVVDPWLYLMKDEAAEKRFRFSLARTLAGARNFLAGYNVSSTPSVMPEAHEMRLIVECSGGTWKEGGPNWVCVSAPPDRALWPGLRSRGATIVATEFVLTGVLRQTVELDMKYK